MKKICSLCKVEKPLDQFNKHSKRPDGLQTVCRDCNRIRSRKYYADNLVSHRKIVTARHKKHVKDMVTYVWTQKAQPCMDCGGRFTPFAMDYDHVRDVKKADVSKLVRSGSSLQTIQAEIAKCDLVCATCHRIRTWNRLQPGGEIVTL